GDLDEHVRPARLLRILPRSDGVVPLRGGARGRRQRRRADGAQLGIGRHAAVVGEHLDAVDPLQDRRALRRHRIDDDVAAVGIAAANIVYTRSSRAGVGPRAGGGAGALAQAPRAARVERALSGVAGRAVGVAIADLLAAAV